jgi:hypothetical protein
LLTALLPTASNHIALAAGRRGDALSPLGRAGEGK